MSNGEKNALILKEYQIQAITSWDKQTESARK